MRFRTSRPHSKSLLPILLAVGVPILLAVGAVGEERAKAGKNGEVTLNVGTMAVEVAGPGWKLRYGSTLDKSHAYVVMKGEGVGELTKLATASDGKVWFAHGGWLRRIDSQKGLVLGRWHFTDVIAGLEPKGDSVEVTYFMQSDRYRYTAGKALISPTTARTVFVNPNNYLLLRIPQLEATRPSEFGFGVTPPIKRSAELTNKLLPIYAEMASRDSFAPFIQAAYGTLLRESGDARGIEFLRRAVSASTADFTELFPLAAHLDSIGEPALAKEAFERGYRDYLERGNDPRMFYILIGRLVLYRPPAAADLVARKVIVERFYRLGPYMEGTNLAWPAFAAELGAHGDPSAVLWEQRGEVSKSHELNWTARRADWMILASVGALWGGLLFVIVQWLRYLPQRRLDKAKQLDRTFFGGVIRTHSYWTRRERYALASAVLISWYTLGVLTSLGTAGLRIWSLPVNQWMGNLASPQAREALERLPETAARNFLLALSFQHAGEPERALRIYLGQPQYAEAWNNLGVIYREKGDAVKAKEAFEKALGVNSGLNEARLNLGQPTSDLWTTQYRNLFPGRPMLAPPNAEQMKEAYLGTSEAGVYLKALAGPLLGRPRDLAVIASEARLPLPIMWFGAILGALTLVLVFILPYREVTQAPPSWLAWGELLLPGSSRSWGWFGGGALMVTGASLAALLFIATVGSPVFLTAFITITANKAYQVIVTTPEAIKMQMGLGVYWWLAPLLVYAINLVFFVRERKRGAR